jgi:hypothetical protein
LRILREKKIKKHTKIAYTLAAFYSLITQFLIMTADHIPGRFLPEVIHRAKINHSDQKIGAPIRARQLNAGDRGKIILSNFLHAKPATCPPVRTTMPIH